MECDERGSLLRGWNMISEGFMLQSGPRFGKERVKGTVSRDFFLQFFPQSVHSGPTRDVLGPF